MARAHSIDGSRPVRRRSIGLLALGLAALAIAGCDGLQLEGVAGGSTGTRQSMAVSVATVAKEENGFLEALRPSRELLARVVAVPSVDEVDLLRFGYAVCRHATRSGDTWPRIERDVEMLSGGPGSEGARGHLLIVRSARDNICG